MTYFHSCIMFESKEHLLPSALSITGSAITIYPSNSYFSSSSCDPSELSQELADLCVLVWQDRENGPWRQVVDWLQNNMELLPEDFRTEFVKLLELDSRLSEVAT